MRSLEVLEEILAWKIWLLSSWKKDLLHSLHFGVQVARCFLLLIQQKAHFLPFKLRGMTGTLKYLGKTASCIQRSAKFVSLSSLSVYVKVILEKPNHLCMCVSWGACGICLLHNWKRRHWCVAPMDEWQTELLLKGREIKLSVNHPSHLLWRDAR